MWSFETDPEYQEKLDWAEDFMRTRVEPLQYVINHPLDLSDPVRQELVPPLQEEVKKQGLWATHLGPELGGPGFGQVKLALLNEILGRSGPVRPWARSSSERRRPTPATPRSSRTTARLSRRSSYLQPLLDGTMFCAFSMTEPQGGSDPKTFTTRAVLDGDEWVDQRREVVLLQRSLGRGPRPPGGHRPRRPDPRPDVDVPRPDGHAGRRDRPPRRRLRLGRGRGWRRPLLHPLHRRPDPEGPHPRRRRRRFRVAQTRLSGGRVHHAMRTRRPHEGRLRDDVRAGAVALHAGRGAGEEAARAGHDRRGLDHHRADSPVRPADRLEDRQAPGLPGGPQGHRGRQDHRVPRPIDIATKALQIHGSLGITDEMPFVSMLVNGIHVGLADGPSEIHKVSIARDILRDVKPNEGLCPSQHIPALVEQARELYGETLARHGR